MNSRAAQYCLAGRMWPVGRRLESPGLKCHQLKYCQSKASWVQIWKHVICSNVKKGKSSVQIKRKRDVCEKGKKCVVSLKKRQCVFVVVLLCFVFLSLLITFCFRFRLTWHFFFFFFFWLPTCFSNLGCLSHLCYNNIYRLCQKKIYNLELNIKNNCRIICPLHFTVYVVCFFSCILNFVSFNLDTHKLRYHHFCEPINFLLGLVQWIIKLDTFT